MSFVTSQDQTRKIIALIQKKDVILKHLQNKIQRLEIRMGYIEQNYDNIILALDNKMKILNKKIIEVEYIIVELKDLLFYKTATQEELIRHQDAIDWISIESNRHHLKEYFFEDNDQDLKHYVLNKLEHNEMTPLEITNYEDDAYSYCEKYTGNIEDFDYVINWLNQHAFIMSKILEESDIYKAVKKVIENGFMTPFR
jgi:hypothetical protein